MESLALKCWRNRAHNPWVGKSSLLRASLIPALQHAQDAGLGLAAIRILTPGEHPARAQARAFDPNDTSPGTGGLGTDTFVVVDQLEETFTLCQDLSERSRFIDLLLAARQPESRLRVLIAVRADFYGHCAEHRGLADALHDANLLVGPMNPAKLREAIVKPATAASVSVERTLTSRLIVETADAPGGLPLLSHVLLETWRRRRGKTMTLAGYEAAAGLEGAVAKPAEEVSQTTSTSSAAAPGSPTTRIACQEGRSSWGPSPWPWHLPNCIPAAGRLSAPSSSTRVSPPSPPPPWTWH
jgi:hypothetical protein